MKTMRKLNRTNVRTGDEQMHVIDATANRLGMSRNRLIVAAAMAFCEDNAREERLTAVVDARLAEQTGKVEAALAAVTAQHDAHDKELRARVGAGLHAIQKIVQDAVDKIAGEKVNP